MRHLYRFFALMLGLGMLGATACTSCMPQIANTNNPVPPAVSYTCGANTHLVGTVCVANNR